MPRKNSVPNHLRTVLESKNSTPDEIKGAVSEYVVWVKEFLQRQLNDSKLDIEQYNKHVIMLDLLQQISWKRCYVEFTKGKVNSIVIKLKRLETRCSVLEKKTDFLQNEIHKKHVAFQEETNSLKNENEKLQTFALSLCKDDNNLF
ncbi:5538_t:CDS:2, partial [Racocetra fulgida]